MSFPTVALRRPAQPGQRSASHILEFDDVHKGSTLHAGAPIIPAALAVAEREHRTGARFCWPSLGYEAALRIGEAVNPSHYRSGIPPAPRRPSGAAAAGAPAAARCGARCSTLSAAPARRPPGLWEFNADGAMSKHLHPGKAAFNGILAADLARDGFTGASRILEGDRGFFRAMSAAYDPTRMTDGLGVRWKIAENCFKLHSCCGHTHTAIDVALACAGARRQLTSSKASKSRPTGPGYEIVSNANPSTPTRRSSASRIDRGRSPGRPSRARTIRPGAI